ncbi:hypothetical protein OG225_07125 [Nocardia sp. NBC_01377]|uniref:hypothetical protein n=1 Tax=Nocardia sp. NBC_01377 TaxID=2903595 RepID=UPI0032498CE3
MAALPTQPEMLRRASAELDHARNALSDGAAWLRSDWTPVGTVLPTGVGDACVTARDEIAAAKNALDRAKDALDRALDHYQPDIDAEPVDATR